MVFLSSLSADLLKDADIDQACFYAEIELEICQELRAKDNLKFKDITKFNKIRRDLALLIDKNVSYEELYITAKKNPSKYLKNVNLFDVYTGNNLPVGKKSYAVSFILQDDSKTLTDTQIDKIMSKLQGNFESQLGASLR